MSWDSRTNVTGYIIYRQNQPRRHHLDPTDETVYSTATDITSTPGAFSDSRIVYAGSAISRKIQQN